MIYTLFFSRLRDMSPEERADYDRRSAELEDLVARDHPAFLGMKTYAAADGERLTVVRFRDEEGQRAWMEVPEHREAQALGRSAYYDRYDIVVCEKLRERSWARRDGARVAAEVDA